MFPKFTFVSRKFWSAVVNHTSGLFSITFPPLFVAFEFEDAADAANEND